jgi:hypothetical protein
MLQVLNKSVEPQVIVWECRLCGLFSPEKNHPQVFDALRGKGC